MTRYTAHLLRESDGTEEFVAVRPLHAGTLQDAIVETQSSVASDPGGATAADILQDGVKVERIGVGDEIGRA